MLSLLHLLELSQDARYFWWLVILMLFSDALLTNVIIRVIPYTEIDWTTYMIQVQAYLKGQLDYTQISGPTGPLVYPAGHLHIHRLLYWITDTGESIRLAQQLYGGLYCLSLLLTCAIYREAGSVPNWIVLLLPLSKRLHSIFVLRLFNDCWSVVGAQAAILAYQKGRDDLGTILFSLALSVKMSVLLYLPGLLVILVKRRGLSTSIRHLVSIATIQGILALPFLRANTWGYIRSSFDLSRVFMYKWTVNWRFVNEQTFLGQRWAKGLLLSHATILVLFGWFKWCEADGGVLKVLNRGLRRPGLPAGLAPITPDYIATILFTSNLIGIVFARSLHYQFYAWYAQQIPFLAWRTPLPVAVKIGIPLAIEWAWNVFPSTPLSSSILLAANVLLLIGVWFHRSPAKEGNHTN